MRYLSLLSLGLLVAVPACISDTAPSTDSGAISMNVAPFALPGIDFACYDVRVTNAVDGGGDTVWSAGDTAVKASDGDTTTLCSDQYGNGDGGAISYVGTCDADGPNGGDRMNSVTIWVDGLYTGANNAAAVPIEDDGQSYWQNPCAAPDGCTLNVNCVENADASVVFNLTIMRDANQGFFDIAVNFDDIFCSAKFDTCYEVGTANEAQIDLLHGDDSARDWTGVFGLACTAGPDVAGQAAIDSTLLLGKIAVDCGDAGVFEIDPSVDEGTTHVATADTSATLNYGIFRGDEQLTCDGQSCNKRYWNVALNLADLEALGAGTSCSLSLAATAAEAADFANGLPTQTNLSWPYISVDGLSLTSDGAAFCQANPLNKSGSGMTTVYRGDLGGMIAPEEMCFQYNDGGVAATGGCVAAATGQMSGSISGGPPNPMTLIALSVITDANGDVVAGDEIGRVATTTAGDQTHTYVLDGLPVGQSVIIRLTDEQGYVPNGNGSEVWNLFDETDGGVRTWEYSAPMGPIDGASPIVFNFNMGA